MFGLCTGGEIGIYNRSEGPSGSHYSCALQKDWIGMQFSIYEDTSRLFQLPMETRWWATGYKPHTLTSLGSSPRTNCTMNATLRFNDAGMAQAFAQALAAKNFANAGGQTLYLDDSYNTERYSINGNTVQLLWRDRNEK